MTRRRSPLPARRPRMGILFILLLLGLASIEAEARLGDSAKQCVRLYGLPVGDAHIPGLIPNGVAFHRGEYSITCGFEEGVCVIVVVLRMAPQDPRLQPIPREDMTLFMTDNFGHTSWDYTRLDPDGNYWTIHDPAHQRTYHASYTPSMQMLTMRVE